MAHFYGALKGNRGETSRLGSHSSGLVTTAASWQGAVRVILYAQDGIDRAHVWHVPWHGQGTTRTLYDGPVSGASADVAEHIAYAGGSNA